MNEPTDLKGQLRALEHVQELDLKIDRLKSQKEALIGQLIDLDVAIDRLADRVAARTTMMSELEKLQKKSEIMLGFNRRRIAKSEAALNAAESEDGLRPLKRELAELNKFTLSLEERAKAAATEVAASKEALEGLHGEIARKKDERSTQLSALTRKANDANSEIVALLAERQLYVSRIEPKVLSQYERIRAARGGIGVVAATGRRCSGCNTVMPTQFFSDMARSPALQFCPRCQRILCIHETVVPAKT